MHAERSTTSPPADIERKLREPMPGAAVEASVTSALRSKQMERPDAPGPYCAARGGSHQRDRLLTEARGCSA